ncbi:MAG: peptidoglycan-binding protein [Cytophagales bacterium CG18_big_fil_WC_8_21_14_2_50_42_9]|nr:MAG: peptidoglycan-binding protein [Cytophagales bacterium CG18_big_fil_WC_8_21_14_2_50_42_9]
MQSIGRNVRLLLLFLFWLSNTTLWAAVTQALPPDSVQKTLAKPVAKGYHLVQQGDTYYGLSHLYQVPVDTLKSWNGANLTLGSTIQISKAATATPKPAAASKASTGIKKTAPAVTQSDAPANTTLGQRTATTPYSPNQKHAQRILVIPFDPYLYFSDADDDISLYSRIPRQNVRHVFRGRLNAFMDPKGFESINLLGGAFHEGVNELDRIYKSVNYSYQDIAYSKYNPAPVVEKPVKSATSWLQRQKEKLSAPAGPEVAGNTSVAKDPNKYWSVKVKDPDFYSYFNQQYAVDYYLFINQFEIFTDYTSCLDRTKNDFVREFVVHYTIYDNQGQLISGNKVRVPYVSHVNDIEIIIRENLSRMAERILADLPRPGNINIQTTSAQ